MFDMPKTNFPRHLQVYADNVVEHFGEVPEGSLLYMEVDKFEDAICIAANLGDEKIQADIKYLERVISNGRWFSYWVKGLWDPKTRKALTDHYTKMKVLNVALMNHGDQDVSIELLPDELTMLGEKLDIGTEFYMVDTHNLNIKTSKITGYHTHGDCKVHFSNEWNFILDSVSFKEGIAVSYGNTYFLDKEKAETALKEAIKIRMAELADQSKQIGE